MTTTVAQFLYDGCEVRAHIDGPTGDRPIVIVPGVGMSHRYSYRLHHLLAEERRVVSLDLPGFGGTRKRGRCLTVEQYADLIGRALDELQLTQVFAVGHSMGTQFVTELALVRPELVSLLGVVAPVVDPGRRLLLLQARDLAHDMLHELPTANAVVISDYIRTGPRWFVQEALEMLRYPIERAAVGVSQPTLVVRGGNDPIVRGPWTAFLARQYPRGSAVEIPDRGHVVQHSAPDRLADVLLRFEVAVDSAAAPGVSGT